MASTFIDVGGFWEASWAEKQSQDASKIDLKRYPKNDAFRVNNFEDCEGDFRKDRGWAWPGHSGRGILAPEKKLASMWKKVPVWK